MKDIFEGIILCSECGRKMEKGFVVRDGFRLRYAHCNNCNERLWHPGDIAEYKHFKNLKQKEFRVKLRLVGNSYAVSIPREIIRFMQAIESKVRDEVRLMLDEMGKLSVIFSDSINARNAENAYTGEKRKGLKRKIKLNIK